MLSVSSKKQRIKIIQPLPGSHRNSSFSSGDTGTSLKDSLSRRISKPGASIPVQDNGQAVTVSDSSQLCPQMTDHLLNFCKGNPGKKALLYFFHRDDSPSGFQSTFSSLLPLQPDSCFHEPGIEEIMEALYDITLPFCVDQKTTVIPWSPTYTAC